MWKWHLSHRECGSHSSHPKSTPRGPPTGTRAGYHDGAIWVFRRPGEKVRCVWELLWSVGLNVCVCVLCLDSVISSGGVQRGVREGFYQGLASADRKLRAVSTGSSSLRPTWSSLNTGTESRYLEWLALSWQRHLVYPWASPLTVCELSLSICAKEDNTHQTGMLWKWKSVSPRAWGDRWKVKNKSKTLCPVTAHVSSRGVPMGVTSLWPSQTPLCGMAKGRLHTAWRDEGLKADPWPSPPCVPSSCPLQRWMPSKWRPRRALQSPLWSPGWLPPGKSASSRLEHLGSPGRGPCGEGPTHQHQHASYASEALGTSVLEAQSDFRRQSHRQHLTAACWGSWPGPANQVTPKCLAHRNCEIMNCSSYSKKSPKSWGSLSHMKTVTDTPTGDWVGVISVPFCWRSYFQITDLSERLVRLDIVNALRRLWLYQLFTHLYTRLSCNAPTIY